MERRFHEVKRKLKSVISMLISVSIILAMTVGVNAEKKLPLLSLKGGYASENSITTVTASLDSEISLAAYSVSLVFDPTLIEFVDTSYIQGGGNFFSDKTAEDCVTFIWSDSKNRKISGNLFTAKFKVKGDTAGRTVPVEIGYSILGNETTEEIPFKTSGCEITVINEYNWGDATCDGVVSASDVIKINHFNQNPEKYPLTARQQLNSDTDSNGIINRTDIENVINYITS